MLQSNLYYKHNQNLKLHYNTSEFFIESRALILSTNQAGWEASRILRSFCYEEKHKKRGRAGQEKQVAAIKLITNR